MPGKKRNAGVPQRKIIAMFNALQREVHGYERLRIRSEMLGKDASQTGKPQRQNYVELYTKGGYLVETVAHKLTDNELESVIAKKYLKLKIAQQKAEIVSIGKIMCENP